MAEFILPKTRKELRSFLGAASYYRRFIKNFASFSSLLSPDTSKYAPSVVRWDGRKLEAFNHLKVCLVNVCVLTIPSQEDCFSLHTDASGRGIGATLNVVREDIERPVAGSCRGPRNIIQPLSWRAWLFSKPFIFLITFSMDKDSQL